MANLQRRKTTQLDAKACRRPSTDDNKAYVSSCVFFNYFLSSVDWITPAARASSATVQRPDFEILEAFMHRLKLKQRDRKGDTLSRSFSLANWRQRYVHFQCYWWYEPWTYIIIGSWYEQLDCVDWRGFSSTCITAQNGHDPASWLPPSRLVRLVLLTADRRTFTRVRGEVADWGPQTAERSLCGHR